MMVAGYRREGSQVLFPCPVRSDGQPDEEARMSVDDRKPVILLTFANDRLDGVRYLRNLTE